MTNPTPAFVSIDAFVAMSGLGRTSVYYRIGDGSLRAVKAGRRTLIHVESGMAWLAALPAAQVKCAPKVA
jgi:hypothetical protein